MKQNKGIALISALLIMMAVMVLGFGSMFLTQMNLRITENSRSNAAAKAHAEAGIDTAIVLLAQFYEQNRRYPANGTFTLPVVANQSYRLLEGTEGYRRDNVDQVRIRVEGFTPNDGRYIAEALLTTESQINRAFLLGMTSEKTISLNGGGGSNFINGGIHANEGVSLSGFKDGTFVECDSPTQPVNTCRTANPLPVSASNNASCNIAGCDRWAKPISIDPTYIMKRNDTLARAFGLTSPEGRPLYYRNALDQTESDGRGGWRYADPKNPSTPISLNWEDNSTLYDSYCTVVYSNSNLPPAIITPTILTTLQQQATLQAQQGSRHDSNVRICARDNLSLNFQTSINMTNVTVVADGNITFGGAACADNTCTAGKLTNTHLISRTKLGMAQNATGTSLFDGEGGVRLDVGVGENVSIFSGTTRNLGSTRDPANINNISNGAHYFVSPNLILYGDTTIASNRNIVFDGITIDPSNPRDPNNPNIVYPVRNDAVTVAVISTRRIENRGNRPFFGVFWAGTGFRQLGSSMVHGSIAVKEGPIDFRGAVELNTFYDIDNTNLYDPPEAQILSRR